MARPAERFGFAVDHDVPIPYMQRIRDYYAALGYGTPYEWAHYVEVPFQPLRKPLGQSRVAIVTTAAPYKADKGDQGAGAPYNAAAKFYAVYSGDASQGPRFAHFACCDRPQAHVGRRSRHLFSAARIAARGGARADRVGGAALSRSAHQSQPRARRLNVDCPEILERCRADAVDAAVLVANCPVCHQNVGLAARLLEANGIATVVMGCAKDIVEHVGVPRFVFSDFPLGNAAGRPNDPESQAATLELALAAAGKGAGRAHNRAIAAAVEPEP